MIDQNDVRHVARLARLRLEPGEAERVTTARHDPRAHRQAQRARSEHGRTHRSCARGDRRGAARQTAAQPAARRSAAQRARGERRLFPRAPDAVMTAGLDPLRLTAREARRLLTDGEIAASELTKTYLDQIARVEGKVHAFIQVTADNAAKYATEIDQEMGATRGALAGLPTAIKDNMVTESVTTTCGSKMLGNYQPVYTATAVRRIWGDHIVMLGKANMDEFAMGSSTENSAFGPTHNPWDLDTVPGRLVGRLAPPPWPPARRCGPWAPTPAAPSVSRRRCAASWASSPPTAPCLALRPHRLCQLARPDRAADPHGRRLRPAAAPHRRPRPLRLDLGGPARRDRATHRRAPRRPALRASPPSTWRRASSPRSRAALRSHRGPIERLGATCVEISLPHTQVRPAGLLHHRAGRGQREPGALRRRALRLPFDRGRRPHRDVRSHPRRGLRRRGQAPHHDRHPRPLVGLLRRLLRPGPEGAHARPPRLRRRPSPRST